MNYLALAIAVSFATPAIADPINTLNDMFSELNRCLSTVELAPGSDMAVKFSLNRGGEIMGRPFYTYAHVEGDYVRRALAMGEVDNTISHCLPLKITHGLGSAVAGRPMIFRLRSVLREAAK